MTHTPAPWTIQHATIANTELHKCIVQSHVPYKDQPQEAQANARLIASAPELLNACGFALEWLENLSRVNIDALLDSQPDQGGLRILRKAIAQAMGKGKEG